MPLSPLRTLPVKPYILTLIILLVVYVWYIGATVYATMLYGICATSRVYVITSSIIINSALG